MEERVFGSVDELTVYLMDAPYRWDNRSNASITKLWGEMKRRSWATTAVFIAYPPPRKVNNALVPISAAQYVEQICALPQTSLDAVTTGFGLYFTVFLENNFVLYTSNRISPIEARKGIPVEEEVPQARLHQIAFGFAFGSLLPIDGSLMDTHGPSFQGTIESLPAGQGANSCRLILTSGFTFNVAITQDSMSTKQTAVALIIHFKSQQDALSLMFHAQVLRSALNYVANFGISASTEFFTKHMMSIQPRQAVAELQRDAAGVTLFHSIHDMIRNFLTAKCRMPLLSVSGVFLGVPGAQESTTEFPLPLSEFDEVAASTRTVANRNVALNRASGQQQSPTATDSIAQTFPALSVSPQRPLVDIATTFHQCFTEMCDYNLEFVAKIVAGIISVSKLHGVYALDGINGHDYDDYWAAEEERDKMQRQQRCPPRSDRDEELLGVSPQSSHLAQSYQTGNHPTDRAHDDAFTAHSAPLNATSLAAAAAADALRQRSQRNDVGDSDLHRPHFSTAAAKGLDNVRRHLRLEPKVVIFTSDAEHARRLMILCAFLYKHGRFPAVEHEALLQEMSHYVAEAQRVTDENERRRGAQSAAPKGTKPLPMLPMPHVPQFTAITTIAATSGHMAYPSFPIVWIAEEFNPKAHLDQLNNKLTPETATLIIAPRSLLVRRIEWEKQFTTEGILVERRCDAAGIPTIVRTLPYNERDGETSCFRSILFRDDAVRVSEFVLGIVKKCLAVGKKTHGVIHSMHLMEEMIEIMYHQSRAYHVAQKLGRCTYDVAETLLRASALLGGHATSARQKSPSQQGRETETASQVSSQSGVPTPPVASTTSSSKKLLPPAAAGPLQHQPQHHSQLSSSTSDLLKAFNKDLQYVLNCRDVDATHVQLLHFLSEGCHYY